MTEKVSLIIPCYNESAPLRATYIELKKVLTNNNYFNKKYNYELVFINDGSTDDTLEIIKELSNIDDTVKYVSFSRNYGKEAAMLAGLQSIDGECVIIIDADLQHPPHLILQMITHYEEGYNQVIAKRSRKGEKFLRRFTTKIYYKLINKLIDVELVDGIGDFRLLSRSAVDALLSMPENNRF